MMQRSRAPLFGLLFTALTASSCGSAADRMVPEIAIQPKRKTESAIHRTRTWSFQEDVDEELCSESGSLRCTVVGLDRVAPDSTSFVATLFIGVLNGTDADANAKPAFRVDGNGYTFPPASGYCHHFQVWRVERTAEDRLGERQKLFEVCNDAHGDAGTGTDGFSMRERVLTRVESRGSYERATRRWTRTATLSLDPLRLLKEEESATDGGNTSEVTWDWTTLRGRESWTAARCTAPAAPASFERVLIPDLPLPEDYIATGWKTTTHADCAAKVDGEAYGHALAGREDPRSARLSVVTSLGSHHFVEVFDDVFTKQGAKLPDTLVLHFAYAAPTYDDGCLDDPVAPEKIEVPLHGKVRRTGSLATSATVDVVPPSAPDSPLRLHVSFSQPMHWFTVEYRDSDDGKSLGRAIATSKLRPDDDASLGRSFYVHQDVQCVQRDGKLEIDNSPARAAWRPLVD
jgi:hypothetical protein